MAFKGFPTPEALELASIHCERGVKRTHELVAADIHKQGLHIDDWTAAVRQLSGIDPNAEDRATLEAEAHIYAVDDAYAGQAYDMESEEEKQLRWAKRRAKMR